MENMNRQESNESEDLKATLLALKDYKKKIENAKEYYDEVEDNRIIKDYYHNIDFNEANKTKLFKQLSQLIKNTHENQLPYNSKTRDYLYSTVDLHIDGTLKSIYSKKEQKPEQVIREDYDTDQKRKIAYDKLLKSNLNNDYDKQKAAAAIENEIMYNCEHVVPQSWFDKDNPMSGDLHHLFTCEKECNSSRSNYPYFDFDDYPPQIETDAIRAQCGKYEEGKFEPENGKGAVARATLYFLLRYPGEVSRYNGRDIEMLLKWHRDDKVSIYEKHRNKEIFQIQKNRNPLIDFPQYANKIDFMFGLS
ncbi:endonuclease I family protein [Metabacillus sediminilitoris]|uniref:Endonuclease I n=2 Tax=Metabacillus sediminilitoris TaxID=2567941 RepID=A0A4S4C1M1_9BACI|nr:endonuclease [Metabacillus sediminilitoris]QGQ48086.1 endonuclease I [Metabacillus sediminilitoris]THF81552.1 endonuclease I [Metabacillus sediminilitoris]